MPSRSTSIGLIFGGRSGEHDVSIRSAATVHTGLTSGSNKDRYTVVPIYIDREGCWWGPNVAASILNSGIAPEQSDLPQPLPLKGFRACPAEADSVDVWYPVLHGPNGEDGTVQGLFELMRMPYVGAGVLGSAMAMDKQAMKAAFQAAGLAQVPFVCAYAADLSRASARETLVASIETNLGYPCFVKPANLGSSVGISKARNREELEAGLELAAKLDPRLVVERGVAARELECAVLGASELQASVVGEIRFDADWYDYTTKYTSGLSQTLVPAPLPAATQERVQQQAIQACKAVGVTGMARVDFFYDEANDQLWLNEINTLPGFTSQSMYPMLWAASGVTLEQLVHELVQSAGE